MDTAKIFKSGRSQAVRLPKAYRFEGSEVFVKRIGSAVVLLPENQSWDLLFEACAEFTGNILEDRAQPDAQSRPALEG